MKMIGKTRRLPLSSIERQRQRDDKLWIREEQRANFYKANYVRCPCRSCRGKLRSLQNVKNDLIRYGRDPTFRVWRGPGSRDSSDEEWEQTQTMPPLECPPEIDIGVQTEEMRQDTFQRNDSLPPVSDEEFVDKVAESFAAVDLAESETREDERPEVSSDDDGDHVVGGADTDNIEDAPEFNVDKLEDALRPLFSMARCSKLSAIVLLLNICTVHQVTNSCAEELFKLLHLHLLPEKNCLPKSFHEAKHLLRSLGLDYVNIHACEDGCALFKDEHKDAKRCPVCKKDRYKDMRRKIWPVKVLRHFPIIPRLLRMFRMPEVSQMMRWHRENESTDGLVRHPTDSKAWWHFVKYWPHFYQELRNAIMAISADGVNPYKLRNTMWSTWPITLTLFNLPPWIATKKFFLMLSLLIPGPQSVTGKQFDVFIRPLLDELQSLWNGVKAYDICEPVGSREFTLRGMVLWCNHDFPAYGTVAGVRHQGYHACPTCGPEFTGEYSHELNKVVFLQNRRFLDMMEPYRKRSAAVYFDGQIETREKPTEVTVEQYLERAEKRRLWLAEGNLPNAEGDPAKDHGVNRRSALFNLPYWKDLLLRHTYDLMHSEKNFAENILKTILGMKDTVKFRRDLKARGIRPHLWLMENPNMGGRMLKPHAGYVLNDKEFEIFCRRLESLKTPSTYGGNSIASAIRRKVLGGLKFHDYHLLMQQLIPLALRGLLAKGPRMTIMRISKVFRQLSCKVWDPQRLVPLRREVAITLCLFEIHFPPGFFNLMTHLPHHLVVELDSCGPSSVRWMFPIERYMRCLKNYVRNMARPEASIAEGYSLDETLGFVTEYLQRFNVTRRRVWDAQEDEGVASEVMKGKPVDINLPPHVVHLAHNYVLHNIEILGPWRQKWLAEKSTTGSTVSFTQWIALAVDEQQTSDVTADDLDVLLLSKRPSSTAKRYRKMSAYGCNWRVDDPKHRILETYDCGVATVYTEESEGMETEAQYVGILEDIIQLDYGRLQTPVVLFRCKWTNPLSRRGNVTYIRDENGFLTVDFRHDLPADEGPFIFPSQAVQVFFSDAEKTCTKIVLRHEPRSKRVMVNYEEAFISTSIEPVGLRAPESMYMTSMAASSVGAIELSDADNLRALAKYTSRA